MVNRWVGTLHAYQSLKSISRPFTVSITVLFQKGTYIKCMVGAIGKDIEVE